MDSLACKLKQPLLLAPRGQGSLLLSDRKTVQKLSRILAIVTEQQTKDTRSQKSNINATLLYVPGLQGCCVANSVPFGQTCPLGQAAGVTVVPLQYLPTNKSRVKRKDA